MGTISDKLTYLNTTKAQLKTMISYGYPLTNETFRQYVDGVFKALINSMTTCDNPTWNNLPKLTTTPGTTQSINNTTEAPMKIELGANELSQSATPTPTSPQAIHTIRGENTIKVEGLNVLNPSNFVSSTEIPSIDRATNIITININSKNNFATIFDNLNIPIGNYTIWAKIESGTYTGGNLCYYDLNDTKYTSEFNFRASTYYYHQFNASNGLKQLRIYAPSATSEVKLKLWIVRGSYTTETMPTYELYKGNSYEINLGKNLLNPVGNSSNSNGIKFINNGDGTFTANGTATANVTFNLTDLTTTPIKLEANKPYTQTLYVLSGTWGGSVVPAFKNGSGTITYNYFSTNASNPYHTKTPTENMTCHTYYYYVSSGTSVTNCTFRVQLEQNNSSTAYAPYFIPIEYCKIGDYKDEFIRTTGKNLCNITNLLPKLYGNGLPTGDSNSMFVDSFDSNNITFYSNSSNFNEVLSNVIQLEPSTQYTIKFSRTTTATNNQWFIYDYDNGTYSINYRDNNTNILEKTFTTNNIGQIALAFGHGNVTGNTTISNIMLNKGTTATTYEPYGKNEWWLKKAIGKVVLDGSENWAADGVRFKTPISNSINVASRGICYSNYFHYLESGTEDGGCFVYLAQVYLYPTSDITTVADFKTWLSTHNTIVYYRLATPTYTKINIVDLIYQLENVYQKMLSQEGQTNISQVNTDLGFIINAIALEDLS